MLKKAKKPKKRQKKKSKRSKSLALALFIRLVIIALPFALFGKFYYDANYSNSGQTKLSSHNKANVSKVSNVKNKDKETKEKSKAKKFVSTHDQRVNRLLSSLDKKLRWEAAKVEVENYNYAPLFQKHYRSKDLNKKIKESIHFGVTDPVPQKSLIAETEQRERLLVLDEEIDEHLANEEIEDNRYEAARKKYVDQFIENARRAGYTVRVDKDYRIRSVRKRSTAF